MTDHTTADKLDLDTMSVETQATHLFVADAVNKLRSTLEAVKRQPNTPTKAFMVNSLERTIAQGESFQTILQPCVRMMNSYHATL